MRFIEELIFQRLFDILLNSDLKKREEKRKGDPDDDEKIRLFKYMVNEFFVEF